MIVKYFPNYCIFNAENADIFIGRAYQDPAAGLHPLQIHFTLGKKALTFNAVHRLDRVSFWTSLGMMNLCIENNGDARSEGKSQSRVFLPKVQLFVFLEAHMSKRSGCKLLGAIALGLSVLGASNAQAGFTTINPPNYGKGGEATQAEILSNSYGGTFTANGLNFTNGTLTATRVNDNADQVFSGDLTSSKALATFAQYKQGFGYGPSASPTKLFDVGGDDFTVTGSTGAVDLPSKFSFDRIPPAGSNGYTVSSLNADNKDKVDHLTTYELTGAGITEKTYVLFWEDKLARQHSDFDFNDLAVEIKGVNAVVVPLPAAAWSGLVTLAGGAIVAGYRKARRQMA